MEAAAMARPVIATDVPGCRHVVQDGVTGYLCKVRSASSLADAMNKMVELKDSDRAKLGEDARRRAETHFSDGLVIDAYFDALSEIGALDARRQERSQA
jgi:glycosyltransferase involved in cell wall biosynthesis